MPERCVAARCDNIADPTKGISMHRIPFLNSENPVAQRRRKKWIDFVLAKRKNWKPGKTSSLCSIHFKEEDFQFRLDSKMKRSLKSDEVGICVYPSIHAGTEVEEPPSKRERRMVSFIVKLCVEFLEPPRVVGVHCQIRSFLISLSWKINVRLIVLVYYRCSCIFLRS